MLVNSANIDISKVAQLFEVPKAITLEQKVETYKKEIEKSAPVNKTVKLKPYDAPLLHARTVLELVCECLELDIEIVKSKTRKRIFIEARNIYSFIILKVSTINITLADAGIIINKDHATVLHAVTQAINLNETNIPFGKKLDKCMTEFIKRFSGAEHYIMDFNNIPQF